MAEEDFEEMIMDMEETSAIEDVAEDDYRDPLTGHIIQFGNTYVHPWKKGDVIWFDWSNIPHSTVNTGPWPRSLAKVTGKITDKYKQFVGLDF